MDIMGLAIRNYYYKKSDEKIGVRINGTRDTPMHPDLFFRTVSRMNGLEKKALQLSRGRVLDVGAAAGCHALPLQDAGLEVVAMDHSSHACEVMGKRGVKNVVCADIFDFHDQKFDTILLMMNGFGIAGKVSRLPAFLQHLQGLLNEGGQILGDSTDILYHALTTESAHLDSYYGEVEFDLEYGGNVHSFPWVYPDPEMLDTCALKVGMACEIIHRTKDHSYLARLVRRTR